MGYSSYIVMLIQEWHDPHSLTYICCVYFKLGKDKEDKKKMFPSTYTEHNKRMSDRKMSESSYFAS